MKKINVMLRRLVNTLKNRNLMLTAVSLVLVLVFIVLANTFLDRYVVRILNNCAIYVVLGLSMNLINGFTGLFSLGHAGFMAVGAYATALLSMSPAAKTLNFYMVPIIKPLANISLPFLPALLIGGLLSAFVAFLIGAPVLKLKGDYLAIATLGFSEIIRIIFTNTQSITNGALGIKGLPSVVNLWWTFGIAVFTIFFMRQLINSSYGRALKAIREDEIAAESMGISLFKHKILSFMIGAFFAGIGGGLHGTLIGTIDPNMYRFPLTFNILLIIVLGGMGSITGTVISAFVITIAGEALRFLDEGFLFIPAIAGLRMVVFSGLLMIVVLFFSRGIMGTNEFSWDKLIGIMKRRPLQKEGIKNERA